MESRKYKFNVNVYSFRHNSMRSQKKDILSGTKGKQQIVRNEWLSENEYATLNISEMVYLGQSNTTGSLGSQMNNG